MSSSPVSPDVDPAIVDRAAAVTRDLCDELRPRLLDQAGTIGSTAKRDGTPVTEIDLEVDRRIRARLLEAFPDHAVVSEEGDTVWPGATWTWLVDPIDGTSNFTAGLPYWCVSIALLHDGVPVYGCIDAPPLDARFEAVRGGGATRDGVPIHVASTVDFRSGRFAHVPLVVTAGTIRRTSGKVRLNARILGSSALDLALVASGTIVAAYQRVPKAWDLAAGSLLVTEAGGAHVVVGEPVLPPVAGQDLAHHSCESLAGPDETWLRELYAAL
jgi:myo-inositol-1(or 4)-monophosphatase